MHFTISNTTIHDKSDNEWINNLGRNKFYKATGWNKKYFGEDLALEFIIDKLNKIPIYDFPLTHSEIIRLKDVLENKLKQLISEMVPETDIRHKINFQGNEIGLNGTPLAKNDSDIWISNFFIAFEICQECIEKNKSIYLSIT